MFFKVFPQWLRHLIGLLITSLGPNLTNLPSLLLVNRYCRIYGPRVFWISYGLLWRMQFLWPRHLRLCRNIMNGLMCLVINLFDKLSFVCKNRIWDLIARKKSVSAVGTPDRCSTFLFFSLFCGAFCLQF